MKKRILITGMNKGQITKDFFLNQHLKIAASHYSLIRCLEDMDYDVEQRAVLFEETSLDQYEEVFFYIHSPTSFCQNLYLGLYTISLRPNAILAFDDWQIDQIYSGIERIKQELEDPNSNVFRQYLLDQQHIKYDVSVYEKYRSKMIDGANILLNNDSRFLISAFSGGDISLLGLKKKIFTFNPNPYHYNRTPENNFLTHKQSLFREEITKNEDKKLEWNFASLMQNKTKKWLKNQNIKNWPINMYGQLKGEEKNERLTEDEMCRVYHQQWGCLMPGYFHAGSGWWRARGLQCADAGSILIGDKKELFVYYNDIYLCNKTAYDIEQMDLSQLINFAKLQKEAIYDNHPLDKNITRNEIRKIMES